TVGVSVGVGVGAGVGVSVAVAVGVGVLVAIAAAIWVGSTACWPGCTGPTGACGASGAVCSIGAAAPSDGVGVQVGIGVRVGVASPRPPQPAINSALSAAASRTSDKKERRLCKFPRRVTDRMDDFSTLFTTNPFLSMACCPWRVGECTDSPY
ncbi:MAG: hypothetical protein CUN48_16900, partial [Candidatus Thermofonsia Clade 3 bacterium]